MQVLSEREFAAAHPARSERILQSSNAKLESAALAFWLPPEASRQMALARLLASEITDAGYSVFIITLWGVWPSHENFELFDRFRRSFGSDALLSEANVHLLAAHETEVLVSLLFMSIAFGWDAALDSSSSLLRMFISHDGWVRISGGSEVEDASILDKLQRLSLVAFSS